jgi:hypothetical protein
MVICKKVILVNGEVTRVRKKENLEKLEEKKRFLIIEREKNNRELMRINKLQKTRQKETEQRKMMIVGRFLSNNQKGKYQDIIGCAEFDEYLTRNSERELFGLKLHAKRKRAISEYNETTVEEPEEAEKIIEKAAAAPVETADDSTKNRRAGAPKRNNRQDKK